MTFHRENKDCPAPQDKMAHLVPWLVCTISPPLSLSLFIYLAWSGGIFFHRAGQEVSACFHSSSSGSTCSKPKVSLYWTYTNEVDVKHLTCFVIISQKSWTIPIRHTDNMWMVFWCFSCLFFGSLFCVFVLLGSFSASGFLPRSFFLTLLWHSFVFYLCEIDF